jgi:hypothetical protein
MDYFPIALVAVIYRPINKQGAQRHVEEATH